MSHLEIANAAVEAYGCLPKRLKVPEDAWSVFSSLVCTKPGERYPKALAIGIGNRCVGNDQADKGGLDIVADCHAEALVGRACRVLFLRSLRKLCCHQHEIFLATLAECSFHLVVSDSPCGDSSIRGIVSSDTSQATHATNWSGAPLLPISLLDERCGSGNNKISMHYDSRDSQVIGCCRLKPGRSDLPPDKRSHSLSCSDKIVLWSSLGFQGGGVLASLMGKLPLHSVIIMADHQHAGTTGSSSSSSSSSSSEARDSSTVSSEARDSSTAMSIGAISSNCQHTDDPSARKATTGLIVAPNLNEHGSVRTDSADDAQNGGSASSVPAPSPSSQSPSMPQSRDHPRLVSPGDIGVESRLGCGPESLIQAAVSDEAHRLHVLRSYATAGVRGLLARSLVAGQVFSVQSQGESRSEGQDGASSEDEGKGDADGKGGGKDSHDSHDVREHLKRATDRLIGVHGSNIDLRIHTDALHGCDDRSSLALALPHASREFSCYISSPNPMLPGIAAVSVRFPASKHSRSTATAKQASVRLPTSSHSPSVAPGPGQHGRAQVPKAPTAARPWPGGSLWSTTPDDFIAWLMQGTHVTDSGDGSMSGILGTAANSETAASETQRALDRSSILGSKRERFDSIDGRVAARATKASRYQSDVSGELAPRTAANLAGSERDQLLVHQRDTRCGYCLTVSRHQAGAATEAGAAVGAEAEARIGTETGLRIGRRTGTETGTGTGTGTGVGMAGRRTKRQRPSSAERLIALQSDQPLIVSLSGNTGSRLGASLKRDAEEWSCLVCPRAVGVLARVVLLEGAAVAANLKMAVSETGACAGDRKEDVHPRRSTDTEDMDGNSCAPASAMKPAEHLEQEGGARAKAGDSTGPDIQRQAATQPHSPDIDRNTFASDEVRRWKDWKRQLVPQYYEQKLAIMRTLRSMQEVSR